MVGVGTGILIRGHVMKPYAERFYSSTAWQQVRNAYRKSQRNLCEVCLANGIIKSCEIVHHKVELTPDNISDPMVSLNWNNLQCVCRDCHARLHGKADRRYMIDDCGRVIALE